MSLLLLFGGVSSGGITPITVNPTLALAMPDEIGVGVTQRVWALWTDLTSTSLLDSDPEIRIYRIPSTGVRDPEFALHYMTQAGDGYYYDWTPSQKGTFLVTVAGLKSTVPVFATATVTARPTFDPVALALDGTLVSRM